MKRRCLSSLSAVLAMMAIGSAVEPAPWQDSSRKLGSPAAMLSRQLLRAAELPVAGNQEFTFAGLSAPPGKEIVLTLKARLHSPKPAGYTHGMRLTLNDQVLDASRLLNWQAEEPRVTGAMMRPAAGETFNVPYAPDFDSPNLSPVYALRTGPKLCRYELRVTDLLKLSHNQLLVVNTAAPEMEKTLVLGDVSLANEVEDTQSSSLKFVLDTRS